jgi:hypothetical protein
MPYGSMPAAEHGTTDCGIGRSPGDALDEPWRMSPAANTPGRLVPSGGVPRRPGRMTGAPRGR